MPFKSRKQEKWMWANKPEMARKWADKYGSFKKHKTKYYRHTKIPKGH